MMGVTSSLRALARLQQPRKHRPASWRETVPANDILQLTDAEGDPVFIRADRIDAVTVGRLYASSRVNGQSEHVLTVLHMGGTTLPVKDPIDEVVKAWEAMTGARRWSRAPHKQRGAGSNQTAQAEPPGRDAKG